MDEFAKAITTGLTRCLSNLEAGWSRFSRKQIGSWKELKEALGREESETEVSIKMEFRRAILSGKLYNMR